MLRIFWSPETSTDSSTPRSIFPKMILASPTSPINDYRQSQNKKELPEIIKSLASICHLLGCLIRLPCSLALGARNFLVISLQIRIRRRVRRRTGAIINWRREAATEGALSSLAVKINLHDSNFPACMASAQSGATLPEEVRINLRAFDPTALPYKTGHC